MKKFATLGCTTMPVTVVVLTLPPLEMTKPSRAVAVARLLPTRDVTRPSLETSTAVSSCFCSVEGLHDNQQPEEKRYRDTQKERGSKKM